MRLEEKINGMRFTNQYTHKTCIKSVAMASSQQHCCRICRIPDHDLSIDHERVKNAVRATLDLAVMVRSPGPDGKDMQYARAFSGVHKSWFCIRSELRRAARTDMASAVQAAIDAWLEQAPPRPEAPEAMRRIHRVLPMTPRHPWTEYDECFDRHVRAVPAMLEEALRRL